MIKNRTAQLIFQSFYCAIGLIGIVASFGIFDDIANPRWDFYVHFTNISNYLCIGVILAQLIQTAKKKEDGYVTTAPLLTFIGALSILLTFLVFNILLAGAADRDPQANWRISSISFHVVLPIMYVANWVLFCEHKKIKWYFPLLSVCFPLVYIAFVYIRAAILHFDATAPYIYPYFFLNLETQGIAGVAKWVVILMAAFVVVGYLFFGLDRLIGKKK